MLGTLIRNEEAVSFQKNLVLIRFNLLFENYNYIKVQTLNYWFIDNKYIISDI